MTESEVLDNTWCHLPLAPRVKTSKWLLVERSLTRSLPLAGKLNPMVGFRHPTQLHSEQLDLARAAYGTPSNPSKTGWPLPELKVVLTDMVTKFAPGSEAANER